MNQKNLYNKIYKNLLIVVVIVIFVTAAILFWEMDKAKAPAALSSQGESLNPISNPSDLTNENLNTNNLDELSIPILMYHYIRTVNDPNDQLGINLSVNPEKFIKQLDYIQEKGYQTITFKDIENENIPPKPVILTFDDGYQDFYANAFPELKKRNMTAVVFVIANKNGGEYLSQSEIKELANSNIEIGSHTLSHPDLSKTTSEKARNEIFQSKTELEKIIGQPVISFCYPAGKYRTETVELIKEAGYKYAATTKPGLAVFELPLELTRDRINADTNIASYIK